MNQTIKEVLTNAYKDIHEARDNIQSAAEALQEQYDELTESQQEGARGEEISGEQGECEELIGNLDNLLVDFQSAFALEIEE